MNVYVTSFHVNLNLIKTVTILTKLNNIPDEKIICSSQVVKVYVHFVTGLQRGMENINFPNRTISTPLSHTHPKKLKLPLQQERLKTTMLENEIKRMESEIKFSGVEVDNEQQTKLMRNCYKKYHPMIIRFCLSLASKSASTYDELRDSKIWTLPSRTTLRDYKNAIRPKVGFNHEIIAELIETASRFIDVHRYVILSIDVAYFATKGVTSYQIMTTFWEAVAVLKLTCELPVIATVSDGASSNRKFIKIHQMLDGEKPWCCLSHNQLICSR